MTSAQLVDNGQNPPGIKWKKIDTEHFMILFPQSISAEAQRTANILERLQAYEGKALGEFPGKTSIVLQNQTVISNGFVTLGPRRAELYTTAPQQTEPVDWITKLAAHELRHIAQVNHVIRTKKIGIPLIQEVQFAIFGASVPVWLIEGDAVITETDLTPAGRGRMPDWEKEFRANVLTGKNYSYSKYFFGSLKDNIPDYYRMGYFMASRLRGHNGDSLFNKILETSVKRSPLPGAFSSSLRKYTGLGTAGLFKATVNDLEEHWTGQFKKLDPVFYKPLNQRKNQVPTNYLLPHFIGNARIICLKRGLGHAPAFVRIDSSGKESRLLNIGPQLSPHFDYAAGKLVWDELKYDPRFRYRDYSVINIYDLESNRYKQLTRRSRLFSPALSQDGKTIVAVKTGLDNQHSLVMLDAASGRQLWESRKFSRQLHTPSPDREKQKIVFMLSGNEGRSMGLYDIAAGTFSIIREADYFDSSYPIFAGEADEKIVFQSHYNGIGNIYSLDIQTGETRQISRARFGAAHPDYDRQEHMLLFNDFIPEGMNITAIDLDTLLAGNQPVIAGNRATTEGNRGVRNTFMNYSAPVSGTAPDSTVVAGIPDRQYAVSDYKGWGRLFNFHSVSPAASADDGNTTLGLRLKSNNLLNTFAFQAGYNYNLSVRSGEYTAGFDYKKFYPVLSLEYINRKREATTGRGRETRSFEWREHETEFSASVPLSFTKRNYLYALHLSSGSSYTSRYAAAGAPSGFIREISFPLINRLSFIRQRIRSPRDLAPRSGQTVSLLHRSLPFDKQLDGELFAFRSLFYFPGIFRHHSFTVSYNFQEGKGQYRWLTEIPEISGAGSLPRTAPLDNTLLLDYRFPIAYPDLELGTFAYIKRIKAGLFADYENVEKAGPPDSFGFELRADANFLRLYMPEFDIGTKVVFLNDKNIKGPVFEWILNYNLAL